MDQVKMGLITHHLQREEGHQNKISQLIVRDKLGNYNKQKKNFSVRKQNMRNKFESCGKTTNICD